MMLGRLNRAFGRDGLGLGVGRRCLATTEPFRFLNGDEGLKSSFGNRRLSSNMGSCVFRVKDHVADSSVKKEFFASIDENRPMEKSAANALAKDMLNFARMNGADTFAHWASPVRGPINLLKHDAFIDLDFSKEDLPPIEKFSGSRLFFNETDGSSFPNGGLRDTHRAAAYLSWDKMSPPFVRDGTLYIPSAFVSWNGDALDEKTPLLRSQEAVNQAGKKLLKYLSPEDAERGVICNVGWEQEFFLIDREKYLERPDLMSCGRTLFGAAPSRGQQTDANYFARVPLRVKKILEELQVSLHDLGVNMSVYHSEVAPGQYEFSPIFSLVNAAADGNVVSMDLLHEVANANDMVALCHEKPFAGLNGSGKHANWGLNIKGTNRNLFVPGKTKEEQRSFVAMVACLMRSLHLHGDLIRTAVASAGNDHRLGAQEAPPAIMSLYLGEGLGKHFENIYHGSGTLEGYGAGEKEISFGSSFVQNIAGSNEDRNRTAPFPFCGNRFEFRAVGSDQNISFPITTIQTAIADSMNVMADELATGKTLEEVVGSFTKQHIAAMFNGDGYSEEWQVEAEKRGLPNLKDTAEALETFTSDKNKQLFAGMKVLEPHEVDARQEVLLEKYTATMLMEANCLLDMMETGALPACALDLKAYDGIAASLAGERVALYEEFRSRVSKLSDVIDAHPHDADHLTQAKYCAQKIKTAMLDVRVEVDQVERMCDKAHWPFPSYHELLFDFQSLDAVQKERESF